MVVPGGLVGNPLIEGVGNYLIVADPSVGNFVIVSTPARGIARGAEPDAGRSGPRDLLRADAAPPDDHGEFRAMFVIPRKSNSTSPYRLATRVADSGRRLAGRRLKRVIGTNGASTCRGVRGRWGWADTGQRHLTRR